MALPSSGNISITQIQTEFGAPAGTALSAFLRGGAYVPDTATNAGVPTALPITVTDFYGASALVPLSVSISGSGTDSDSVSPFSTTTVVTANASGGSGTKSYVWTRVSGHTGFTESGMNTNQLTLSESGTADETFTATYKVTVTDDTGSAEDDIFISHTHGVGS